MAGFRPQFLTAQFGGDGFEIVFRQFFGETRHTKTLLCPSECLTDSNITDEPELVVWAGLMATFEPRIQTASGNQEHATHGFDAELSLMLFDEGILHLRRFAKSVAAFGEWPAPLPAQPVSV